MALQAAPAPPSEVPADLALSSPTLDVGRTPPVPSWSPPWPRARLYGQSLY